MSRGLGNIRNFALYYGVDKPASLQRFDLLILEPKAWHEADLASLKQGGRKAVGYISAMELPAGDEACALLTPEDFLHAGGQPVRNDGFGTALVNPASSRWRNLLAHRIGRLIHRQGVDGIFLDTLGDVEWPIWPREMHARLVEGACELVRGIRERFPEMLIIQNNGLNTLIDRTQPMLDGVCWENPPLRPKRKDKLWLNAIAAKLANLKRQRDDLAILGLWEDDGSWEGLGASVAGFASRHGLIPYIAPKDYCSDVYPPLS